jgi:Fe-S-cluster-containing hydrogenase component 2
MDLQFFVDKEACIGCGECVKVCPYGVLQLDGEVAAMSHERRELCMHCQHCLAVCGTGALSILGKRPADSVALPNDLPSVDQLANLMMARRSVRRYRKTPLTREEIDFLLKTAAYAPTGRNNRQVLFTVVEEPEVMETLRWATYDALMEKINNGGLPERFKFLEKIVTDAVLHKRDDIFRGAPHLLIASSPADGVSPDADSLIALSYFELLAAGMGIGSLWCGLAKWTLTMLTPEILRSMGVPDSHLVGYMMVFGRPAVTFHRTVQRDDARINRVGAIRR